MDKETPKSGLCAAALDAAKRKLVTQPLITALLAGTFIGVLISVFGKLGKEARPAPALKLSYFLLAAVFLVILLVSVLRLIGTVRDLRAAKAGSVRVHTKAEKRAVIILSVFAAALFLSAFVIGAYHYSHSGA